LGFLLEWRWGQVSSEYLGFPPLILTPPNAPYLSSTIRDLYTGLFPAAVSLSLRITNAGAEGILVHVKRQLPLHEMLTLIIMTDEC
jgi:hypothetical protein